MKTVRVLKSWSKHNVPDELWPEVLSRLPVKSLLRFRCVSRSWKTLIDDPHFTRLHLSRFNNRSQSQILFVSHRGQCLLKNSETLRTNFNLDFLQSDLLSPNALKSTSTSDICSVNWWSICSSFDGLFLLQCGSDLMLWNPSIRKTLPLPPLPKIPSMYAKYENADNVSFGLGFDPLIRDYKAVKFFFLPKKGVQFAAVYTLGTNSWKLIEYRVEGHKDLAFLSWQSSISFNGVLYGLSRDWQTPLKKLTLFDLRTEVFASVELPVADLLCKYYLSVIDVGCSPALICLCMTNVSIWELEVLGDDTKAWSWIQRCPFVSICPPGHIYDIDFLCIKKNGEMLMKQNNMVLCYNLETQEGKMMMKKNRKTFGTPNMFTYKESLILNS